jgi:hypothetical protein
VDPIERSLHIREAVLKTANQIGIWRDPKANALHKAGETPIGLGHHVNIGSHSGDNVRQLPFAEIGNDPPSARVNQSKYLLTYMGVGAFRNLEVCHSRLERCANPAVIEVIARAPYRGFPGASLVDERFKGGDSISGLLVLRFALLQGGLGLLMLCHG